MIQQIRDDLSPHRPFSQPQTHTENRAGLVWSWTGKGGQQIGDDFSPPRPLQRAASDTYLLATQPPQEPSPLPSNPAV